MNLQSARRTLMYVALITGAASSAKLAADVNPPSCARQTHTAGGFWPARSGCCAAEHPSCTQPSLGLAGGRRNLVLAILDDHGHCQNGFMWGRCATKRNRCRAEKCSNAPWLDCSTPSDCPPGTGVTCAVEKFCSNASTTACTDPGVSCPAPPCGGQVACVYPGCGIGESCTHGYCSQCVTDANCTGSSAGEICVDGLCSPRAVCVGDFQCARAIGRCLLGGQPCPSGGAGCQCEASNAPCGKDSDCNDTCEADGKCRRTPAACGVNDDCGPGHVCTSGRTPLRLHDLACRYRQPGALNWPYDETVVPAIGEQVVYTPTLDALAREGAMFPRARVNGQSCKPTRASMMLGRFLRHRNGLFTNSGRGVRECRLEAVGCPSGELNEQNPMPTATCPGAGNSCDRVHSIAWWLAHPEVSDPGCTGANCAATRIAAGKLDQGAGVTDLSFDREVAVGATPNFGKFLCNADCEAALNDGAIPTAVVADGVPTSIDGVMDEVRNAVGQNGSVANRIFLWFAPNLPHDSYHAPLYMQQLYEPLAATSPSAVDEGEHHLARTSQIDVALQALVDEYKRTCICPPAASVGNPLPMESLYDHTELFVVPDNAYMLPEAKNDTPQNFGKENAHRGAFVFNRPEDRNGTPGRILDEQSQLAGSPDLLPTIVDYMVPATQDPDSYPLSTTLKPFVEGGMAAGWIRPLFYGHASGNENADETPDGRRNYVIPRPGFLGLCSAGNNALTTNNHPRPCRQTSDCGNDAGAVCKAAAMRCVNNSRQLCEHDGECAPAAMCTGNACVATGDFHVFADFQGKACASGLDCVPQGICRPPMLKMVRKNTGNVTEGGTELYDLNVDPDENDDLFLSDPAYLGNADRSCTAPTQSLGEELNCCLKEYWALRDVPLNREDVWLPAQSFGCPAELKLW